SLLESFRRISHPAQYVVCVFELFLLRRELRLLFSDDSPTASGFIELCKADVKSANDSKNNDGEENDLSAGIDLANKFTRELAEKNLGVVASRGGRSLHCRLLNEGRDVRAAAAAGDQRRTGIDGKEMNGRAGGSNPNFISVI